MSLVFFILILKCDSIVQRWVGVVILIHMIFFYFSKKKNCSGCKYMFRSVSTMSCLRESFGFFKKKYEKRNIQIMEKKYTKDYNFK